MSFRFRYPNLVAALHSPAGCGCSTWTAGGQTTRDTSQCPVHGAPSGGEAEQALLVIEGVADLIEGYQDALRHGDCLHANDFGNDPRRLRAAATVLHAALRSPPPVPEPSEAAWQAAAKAYWKAKGETHTEYYRFAEAADDPLAEALRAAYAAQFGKGGGV
jgi:hypothetical protein